MIILAIETSCDETAIALVEAKGGLKNLRFKILKNLVASQIKIHQPYGGVVPNLAKREHLKNLPILLQRIKNKELRIKEKIKSTIQKKSSILNSIDLIAVTIGPGLEPALWTGINFAKELYQELRIKNKKLRIIGTNHLDGHLYSFLLQQKTINLKFKIQNLKFPAIALLVSGGHTILIKIESFVKYKKLGETRDDAVGEAFDKVARLLSLAYPGGPEIEKLAKKGDPNAINFPRPMINQKNYDFSFSGLKTAVLYYLRDYNIRTFGAIRTADVQKLKADIAASFQKAAFDVLIAKTLRAVKEYNAKSIFVSGGVAANISLKKYLQLRIKNEKLKIHLFIPSKKLCTDNAAMIAAAGHINYLKKKSRRLIAQGNLTI